MRTDQALRPALAALSLAAAATAAAQLAGPVTSGASPGETLPNPYAHNEQGNFRTCAAVDLALEPQAPPPCRSDWDASGAITSRDISEFVQDWITDAGVGTTVTDFNDDGVIGSADLSAFLSAWTQEVADGC